jgi:hypothetical protein
MEIKNVLQGLVDCLGECARNVHFATLSALQLSYNGLL